MGFTDEKLAKQVENAEELPASAGLHKNSEITDEELAGVAGGSGVGPYDVFATCTRMLKEAGDVAWRCSGLCAPGAVIGSDLHGSISAAEHANNTATRLTEVNKAYGILVAFRDYGVQPKYVTFGNGDYEYIMERVESVRAMIYREIE